MSLIFSTLTRLKNNEQNREDDNYPTVSLGNIFDINNFPPTTCGRLINTHLFIDKEETMTLFADSEKFLINSQKLIYLENIEYEICRITYLFRPEVCVRMAIFTTVKKISGQTNNNIINNIIRTNMEIYRYFVRIYKISKVLYEYSFYGINDSIDLNLVKQIIASMIELFNFSRHDGQHKIPYISYQIIKELGADLYIEGESIIMAPKDCFERGKSIEYGIIESNFYCNVCGQFYSTNEELITHVSKSYKKDGSLICTDCDIEFTNYADKVTHHLSFCRRCFNDQCLHCNKDKKDCSCIIRSKIFYEEVYNWAEERKDVAIYDTDFYSTFFQYFSKNSQRNMAFLEEQKPLWPEEDDKDKYIDKNWFPEIIIQNGLISCEQWDITPKPVKEIKMTHNEYFDIWIDIEFNTLNIMKDLRKYCFIEKCNKPYTPIHAASNHVICTPSGFFKSNEIPVRFNTMRDWIDHLENHFILQEQICPWCDHKFTVDKDNCISLGLYIRHICLHYNTHEKANLTTNYSRKCDIYPIICNKEIFTHPVTRLIHDLQYHITNMTMLHANIVEFLQDSINYSQIRKKDSDRADSEESNDKSLVWESLGKLEQTGSNYDYNMDRKNLKTIWSAEEKKNIKMSTIPNRPKEALKTSTPVSGLGEAGDEREEKGKNEEKLPILKEKDIGIVDIKDEESEEGNFICYNENHDPDFPTFETQELLEVHCIKIHKCFWKGTPSCSFYNMMESVLIKHFKQKHMKKDEKCDICNTWVLDLPSHIMLSHPKCPSCQQVCMNRADLQKHELQCTSILMKKEEILSESNLGARSLNFDENNSDFFFSQTLLKILDATNLTVSDKEKCKNSIQRYSSENHIAKSRLRDDHFPESRGLPVFFEIPEFQYGTDAKENTSRVQSYLGVIKEEDIFSPQVESASKLCVKNYENLDNILRRLQPIITICALREDNAKQLLINFMCQGVVDNIESYSTKLITQLTYAQIVKFAQYIYIPIHLESFLRRVLSYKKNDSETFLEFSSRCYRHLVLCSKLYEEEKRSSFIEKHRVALMRQSLPVEIQTLVRQKESLYNPFNSQELIDLFLNHKVYSKLGGDDSHLDVLFTQKKRSGKTGRLRAKLSQNHGSKPYENNGFQEPNNGQNQQQSSQNRFDNSNKGQRFGRNRYGNSFKRGQARKFVQNIDQARLDQNMDQAKPDNGFRSFKSTNLDKVSDFSREKLKILGPQYANMKGYICFLCLSPGHIARNCNVYKGEVIQRDLCFKMVGNMKQPCGFHRFENCKKKYISSTAPKNGTWQHGNQRQVKQINNNKQFGADKREDNDKHKVWVPRQLDN